MCDGIVTQKIILIKFIQNKIDKYDDWVYEDILELLSDSDSRTYSLSFF